MNAYYVDSRASGFGDGTKDYPFSSPLNLSIPWGDEAVVYLARGSEFTLTGSWVIGPNTTVKASGSGARPILTGADAAIYGLIRLEDSFNVLVEDVIVQRARHGVLIEGATENVTFRRVMARDMYGLGGFAHEDTAVASGRVWYDQCEVQNMEGDGFSNRGGAFDLITDAVVAHCGPIWGVHELDYRIPVEPGLVNYLSVATTRPVISRNVYVDTAGGDDANDGLSPNSPWATHTKINSSSLAGDRVHVKRGSDFTGSETIIAKTDQHFLPYGTGRRPYGNTFNNDTFLVNDVKRVTIEGFYFKDAAPGVLVTGDVEDIWVVDCLFDQCETFGVQANDAAGSGDVNIFGCGFHWNDDGSVHGTAGSYVISGWNCKGHDNARTIGTTAAAAWRVAGACSFKLYNVEEDDPYYRGLALEGTGSSTIFGCWFNGPQDNAAVTVGKGIEVTTTGTTEISNTVVTIGDPGSGDSTIGVEFADASGTNKLYNCTLQDARASGGTGSSCLTVGQTTSTDVQNCLFENRNGTASSYYVTLDADATGEYTFSHNWYHDWSGAGTADAWRDDGGTAADMAIAAWQAVDGNVEDTAAGGFVTTNLTTTMPATIAGYEARIEDLSSAIHWLGKDLQAAGLVTWTTDAGHRERGRGPSGNWMPGAWVNSTGAPDGATTHADSGMRIEDSKFSWCHHAFGFTHDQLTTEDEMALLRCTIEHAYHETFQTLFTRAFPIRDNVFKSCQGSGISINAPSGTGSDVWEITGNHFYNTGGFGTIEVATTAAGTTFNIASNIIQMPETLWWPRPSETAERGISMGGSANCTVNCDNNVLWMPFQRNGLGFMYCIRNTRTGSTLNMTNNMFFAPDESSAAYVRINSTGDIGTIDDNFYWLATTNLLGWHNAGGFVNFANWKATTNTPDVNAWEQTLKICGRPDVGDERFIPAEAFRVSTHSPQASAGTNRAATTRWAIQGGIRPASGNWTVGPFVASVSTNVMLRSQRRLILSGFILASTAPLEDIPIRLMGTPNQLDLRMVLKSICLTESSGNRVAYVIHEGTKSEGNIVYAGAVTDGGDPGISMPIRGSIGKPLFLSFISSTGTVSGVIEWDWEREVNPQEFRPVPAPKIGGPVK